MDIKDFFQIYNDIVAINLMLKKIPKENAEEILSRLTDKEQEELTQSLKLLQKIIEKNFKVL